MSSPESLMNKLHRGNFSEALLQEILTSFQAVPKLVDEDIDDILIVDAPETRDRIQTTVINPGGVAELTETRDRHGALGYIRKLPSQVNVYPATHTTTGTFTFLTTDKQFTGGAEFDGSTYISIPNTTRFTPNQELSVIGWLNLPASSGTHQIIHKSTSYIVRIISSNRLQFLIRRSGSWSTRTTTYTPDTWFHFACTYSGTEGNIYIDGSVADTNTFSNDTINPGSGNVGIGATATGVGKIMNGAKIAHLSMINNAVSSSWVTDHMNGILDTSGTNIEITTIPFVAHENPLPDASVGKCQVN